MRGKKQGVANCVLNFTLRLLHLLRSVYFLRKRHLLRCYADLQLLLCRYFIHCKYATLLIFFNVNCIFFGFNAFCSLIVHFFALPLQSHSALGSQWPIPLHLIGGRPRPLLSPCELSSLGTPMILAFTRTAYVMHTYSVRMCTCNIRANKVFSTNASSVLNAWIFECMNHHRAGKDKSVHVCGNCQLSQENMLNLSTFLGKRKVFHVFLALKFCYIRKK